MPVEGTGRVWEGRAVRASRRSGVSRQQRRSVESEQLVFDSLHNQTRPRVLMQQGRSAVLKSPDNFDGKPRSTWFDDQAKFEKEGRCVVLGIRELHNAPSHGARSAGLRLVAQPLFVAVFFHALAAFVFRDFRLSLLFNGTHGFSGLQWKLVN